MKVKLRPDQITTGSWGAERRYDRVTGLTPASLHEPLQSPDHIRLMLLYPPGWPDHKTERVPHHLDTNIQCKVFQAHLDDLSTTGRPNFAALSYCWGSTEKRRSMICNQSRVRITENLFQALKWIRLSSRPRLLWVDYLSISQTDLAEKSEQVARMGWIFHQAHVISYIGGNKNIHLAGTCLAVIRRLSNVCDHIVMVEKRSEDDKLNRSPVIYERNRPFNMPEWGNVPWNAIAHLLNGRYFSRLWVFQEIRQARSHTFQWGLHFCNMHNLYEACKLITADGSKTLALSSPIGDRLRFMNSASGLMQLMYGYVFLLDTDLEVFEDDFAVVAEAMHFACSDPKDHIYGVASLFQGPKKYSVDYSLDVAEVFAGFICHLLSTRNPERLVSLFMFSRAHYSTFRNPDAYARQIKSIWSSRLLPSWCPDFGLNRPESLSSSVSFYSNMSVGGPNSRLPACVCPLSSRILRVRGVRCATISACSRQSQNIENGMAFTSQSGQLAMRLLSCTSLTNVSIELLDALREGTRSIWREVWPSHPFNTTKSQDQYWSILESFAPFFLEKYVPCLYAVWATSRSNHAGPIADLNEDQIKAFVDEMWDTVKHYAREIRRCFITTPDGPLGCRIGCGSDAVRSSDEIFVLYGVTSPIAIRRVGNQGHYKYVGNCYLDGLMFGEAPKIGLPVEDILLV